MLTHVPKNPYCYREAGSVFVDDHLYQRHLYLEQQVDVQKSALRIIPEYIVTKVRQRYAKICKVDSYIPTTEKRHAWKQRTPRIQVKMMHFHFLPGRKDVFLTACSNLNS